MSLRTLWTKVVEFISPNTAALVDGVCLVGNVICVEEMCIW
jgi:hypothetical protein